MERTGRKARNRGREGEGETMSCESARMHHARKVDPS